MVSPFVKYHDDIVQGTDEWYDIRRGLLTASEMKLIITPSELAYSSNEKERAHVYEIAAQQISKYTEPSYVSDDMVRGTEEEYDARAYYSQKYAPVKETGFITNKKWGFTLGCSPDGLVGDNGMIEIKSRRQKFQVETVVKGEIPVEHYIQVQSALLVSERGWNDFISHHGGLHMAVIRTHPDEKIHDAIVEASGQFYKRVEETMRLYWEKVEENNYLLTKRIIREEMYI